MIRTRIIPVLLLQGERLIKTKKFSNAKYIGDPINAIKIFNELMVDELIIIDIEKRLKKSVPDFDFLSKISENAFMPVCYGGGISSVSEAKKIIGCGVEKVCLNYSVNKNSEIFKELTAELGAASVVACIDIKRDILRRPKEYNYITKKTGLDLSDLVEKVNALNVGELLINDVDREGTRKNYDKKLLELVAKHSNLPYVVLGGAGSRQHLKEAVKTGAPALGAASLFIYMGTRDGVLINYPTQQELIEICGEEN